VQFSLCLAFCSTLATSFASLVLIDQALKGSSFGVSSSGVSFKLNVASTLDVAATALSLVTNLFATILISIQLWRHCRFINHSGLHRHSLTSSQRILLFLVEGGFIFCIGQTFDFCLNTYDSANVNLTFVAYFTTLAIDTIFWASMPTYLPVIILLVANNGTITETFSFDSKVLAEVAHVETASPQEGAPDSESTGAVQVSAHEGSDTFPSFQVCSSTSSAVKWGTFALCLQHHSGHILFDCCKIFALEFFSISYVLSVGGLLWGRV